MSGSIVEGTEYIMLAAYAAKSRFGLLVAEVLMLCRFTESDRYQKCDPPAVEDIHLTLRGRFYCLDELSAPTLN